MSEKSDISKLYGWGKKQGFTGTRFPKFDDAYDVLLYWHILLPKVEDLVVVNSYILKVPLVSHPKGLFLSQKS